MKRGKTLGDFLGELEKVVSGLESGDCFGGYLSNLKRALSF